MRKISALASDGLPLSGTCASMLLVESTAQLQDGFHEYFPNIVEARCKSKEG